MKRIWNSLTDEAQDAVLTVALLVEAMFLFALVSA